MNYIKLDKLTTNTKISDLGISTSSKLLLSNLKVVDIKSLFLKSRFYFAQFDGISTRKLSEIRSLLSFLESMILVDFDFEDWIEHNCDLPLNYDSEFEHLDVYKPISHYIQLDSYLVSKSLYEIIELKRGTNHSMHDLIELNLVLWHISLKYKISYSSFEQTDYNLVFDKDIMDSEAFLYDKLNELTEVQRYIISYRFELFNYEHKTLEQLGDDLNLTRERVRQVEKKAITKFISSLKSDKYWILNSARSVYVLYRSNIFNILLKDGVSTEYYCQLDQNASFRVSKKALQFFELDINHISDQIKTNGNFDIKNYSGIFDEQDLLCFYSVNYVVSDNIIFAKHSITSAFLNLISDKIEMVNFGSDIQITQLISLLNQDFNLGIDENSIRTIENIAIRYLVMIGPRSYKHESKIKKVSSELINEIQNRIERFQITSSFELYNSFRNKLNEYEIINPTGLYGYLKFFMPDKFEYGGVSLVISKKGYSPSWNIIIRQMIVDRGEPIEKSEITELYSDITEVVMNNLFVNEPDFIQWGRNKFFLDSLISIEKNEKTEIWKFVNRAKIVSASQLYVFLYENLNEVLLRNFITSEEILLRFVNLFFEDHFEVKFKEKLIISK